MSGCEPLLRPEGPTRLQYADGAAACPPSAGSSYRQRRLHIPLRRTTKAWPRGVEGLSLLRSRRAVMLPKDVDLPRRRSALEAPSQPAEASRLRASLAAICESRALSWKWRKVQTGRWVREPKQERRWQQKVQVVAHCPSLLAAPSAALEPQQGHEGRPGRACWHTSPPKEEQAAWCRVKTSCGPPNLPGGDIIDLPAPQRAAVTDRPLPARVVGPACTRRPTPRESPPHK